MTILQLGLVTTLLGYAALFQATAVAQWDTADRDRYYVYLIGAALVGACAATQPADRSSRRPVLAGGPATALRRDAMHPYAGRGRGNPVAGASRAAEGSGARNRSGSARRPSRSGFRRPRRTCSW